MYEWAARLSGVLNLFVVQSFQLAFTVIGLKTMANSKGEFHRLAFNHYVVWAGWIALGVSVLSYELTLLLGIIGADARYVQSTFLVFPLALGILIYGVYVIVNNVLYATSKTNLITRNVIIAAGSNVLLNLILVPFWGAFGAAISTVLSYLILLGLSERIAKQHVQINYQWRNLGLVILLLTVLYFIALSALSLSDELRLPIRILVLTMYVPIIFLLKIYDRKELKKGWALIQHFIKKE